MATFEEFYKSIETDKSGKRFEKFVKWFLKNEPMWKLIVDEIWLWDEYPDRWSRDKGIDLVFKDKRAGIWAVQAKQYDSNTYISKPDIDSFLSESGKQNIKGRLLIASTNAIGTNAMEVITNKNTFPPVKTFLLSDFNKVYQEGFEFPLNMEELKSVKKRTILNKNKKFQTDAVDATLEGFKRANRGQLIMACGTGKTIVTLFIKEQMKSKLTMVMLPSLLLVSNTLRKWTSFAEEEFEFLCVCSDKKVTKMINSDDDDISSHEIPLVSNDPEEIKNFMNLKTNRVVFCTYQSSPLLAEVHKNKNIPSFDLVVCDEAHRTTGVIKKETAFTTILDEGLIRAHKRLFVTATPRYFSFNLKKKAEETGCEAIDMSDEKVYGRVFFEYLFGQAIQEEELSDYQVLVTGVNEKLYKDMIDSRRLIKTKLNNRTDSKSYALQLAVLKAIKKYNLSKLISFHGRKKNAEYFSKEIKQTSYELSNDSKLEGNFLTGYVDGSMSTFLREKEITKLENVYSPDCFILANAKCLSEGVDIPTLDGIVFVDPRESEVDIIQSVGRAIRKSNNKTKGTIILPVFIKNDDKSKEEIEKSDFKKIWKVINALKAHDYKLGEVLSSFRNELGRKGKKYISKSIPRFTFILPKDIDESFERSLQTRLVEVTTESWEFMYGKLQNYIKKNGHAGVPSKYKDGVITLGRWTSRQRQFFKDGTLSQERINKLNLFKDKGWVWDIDDEKWDNKYKQLQNYIKKEDNARVPFFDKSGLGRWSSRQRQYFKDGTLSQERINKLNLFKDKGWKWDIEYEQWQMTYELFQNYIKKEGHTRVPAEHKENGLSLGRWVRLQRGHYKKGKLSQDKIDKLEMYKHKGWVWVEETPDLKWQQKYELLQSYIKREGTAKISVNYKEGDFALGNWISIQRGNYKKGKLSQDRIDKLERYKHKGWVWDADTTDLMWQKNYKLLQNYIKREGSAIVSVRHKEEGFSLGGWVRLQRKNYKEGKLSLEKIDKLERYKHKGWGWNALEVEWQRNYKLLQNYIKREGNARVPARHKEEGFSLGGWVDLQKRNYEKRKLSQDKIDKLEMYKNKGWVWDNKQDAEWQNNYEVLQTYIKREGTAKVPYRYKEGNIALGAWVKWQRTNFKNAKLSQDKINKLEIYKDKGWVWDVEEAEWKENYEILQNYIIREGHARVPFKYIDNNINLGTWVSTQRINYKNGTLPQERIDKLEMYKHKGWGWNALEVEWQRNYKLLQNYIKREGNARVPARHKEEGFSLGYWVHAQKHKYKKGELSQDRIDKLEKYKDKEWNWKG